MNPYDILGVPPTVSADEIKQAFRRKASEHHPDKGGHPEHMQEVNAAYDVLSDPGRRAHFDETGSAEQLKPLDREAQDMLLQLLQGALVAEARDVLGDVRQMLGMQLKSLEDHRLGQEIQRDRFKKRSGQYRRKNGGFNLVQGLIDSKLAEIEMALKNIGRGLEVVTRAQEMLAEFEDTAAATNESFSAQMARIAQAQANAAASTSWWQGS